MNKIISFLSILMMLFTFSIISYADSDFLPENLIEIGEEAFYGDTSITEVTVPDGTTTIGPRAFACSGLRKISLPDTIDSIDPTAFDNLSQDIIIVAPYNSYSYHYAVNHHFRWGDSAGKGKFTVKPLLDNDYKVETVNVVIPNCQRVYHLLYLSDLHLIVVNDEIADDKIELVQTRLDGWESPQLWETLPGILDDCNADMLLFGGDMIDYCSGESFKLLKDGINLLDSDYMYVRADHDTEPYWLKDQDKQKCVALHDSLPDNTDVIVKEFPDFVLLGINNSISQLTEEGLHIAKDAFAPKKTDCYPYPCSVVLMC